MGEHLTAASRLAFRRSVMVLVLLASTLTLEGAEGVQERGVAVLSQSEEEITPYRRKVALVVGIDRYASGIPPLRFAVKDARAVEALLRHDLDFDEVVVLENEDARRADILRTIVRLHAELTDHDQFFFYFAGHGESIGRSGDEMGYLISQEVPALDEGSIVSSGLSMVEVREHLLRLPAKHVLLAVDACYSGFAAVVARGVGAANQKGYLNAITSAKARQILTAGKRGESALESAEWGHSAFTTKLIQGLRERLADRDRDGIVTAVELFSYVAKSVHQLTGGAQTPQFADLSPDEGEFVFVLPPADHQVMIELSRPTSLKVEGDRVEIFDRLGTLLWQYTAARPIVQGLIADLDGDEVGEVLLGIGAGADESGRVLALDFRGALLWSWDASRPSNYDGGHSGRFTVRAIVAEELLSAGARQVAVLAVDAAGWPPSYLALLDKAGRQLSHYWHPGELQTFLPVRISSEGPWRLLVAGINSDLPGPEVAGAVFLLDPATMSGEAPPHHGQSGEGRQVWYGVVLPRGSTVARLQMRDVDSDGVHEILIFTDDQDGLIVSLRGSMRGHFGGSTATGFVRVE